MACGRSGPFGKSQAPSEMATFAARLASSVGSCGGGPHSFQCEK